MIGFRDPGYCGDPFFVLYAAARLFDADLIMGADRREVILLPKEEKIEKVEELRQDIEGSSALLLTDYRGLSVSAISDLRRKLRESGAEYKVIKNTLFRRAAGELAEAGLGQWLVGPTAIAIVRESDPIAPARAIVEFMRDHKALNIKGAYFEGQFYGPEQVQALSKIPPREVLLAQAIGSMQSPISGLTNTLYGLMSNLAYTIQAVADSKSA